MKNNKGYTLIELSIVIGTIGLLMLIIGNIVSFNINNFKENTKYYTYKLDGRYAMNKVLNELKKNYNITYDSGKILASDLSVLINSNPNDADGLINFYYDANKYGENDGYGELRGANGEILAKNIKAFLLEQDENNMIKITIKTGGHNNSDTFELVTHSRIYN